jgi:hypothetical protein
MTIHFYLNDDNETEITSMYNLPSNPFKIGDELLLDVEELYPVHYNKFKEKVRENMIRNSKDLENKFHRKRVRIVKEYKFLRFRLIEEAKLNIEYHCELI